MPMVGPAESGQKLLQFLERRLELPPALLHRWIRTGQIRLNGRRCKPFCRVNENDLVRLPPFVEKLANLEAASQIGPGDYEKAGLKIVGCHDNILALDKPAGLPVHGGSKHLDSVTQRLRKLHGVDGFIPGPGHRLDRETSGILLLGASWQALNFLQKSFAERKIHKEYICWVQGNWPFNADKTLTHFLKRQWLDGFERTCVHETEAPGRKKAAMIVRCLKRANSRSLLQVRLLTGKKHQIRAQLAYMGYPILGDKKYGHAVKEDAIFLHCLRMVLPDGMEFAAQPGWPAEMTPGALPDMMRDISPEERQSGLPEKI